MTARGRKLHFIDFFRQCCLNATRGRDRVAAHPPSFGMQKFGSDDDARAGFSAGARLTSPAVDSGRTPATAFARCFGRGELPPKLRQSVLLIKDKEASGTSMEDAETLAGYARLARGTNGFNAFVDQAMGLGWRLGEM